MSGRTCFIVVYLLIVGLLTASAGRAQKETLHGQTFGAGKAVGGARVRMHGSGSFVMSDKKGRFHLPLPKKKPARVTAWKKGFAIGSAVFKGNPIKLALLPLPAKDNEEYRWIDPRPNRKQPNNCGNCHPQIYKEWAASGHSSSVHNKRFQNLFGGRDSRGRPSARWNVMKEHPLGSSVCANCHAPTFDDPTLVYDMRKVPGVAARGAHCDYCHKIVDAPTKTLGITFGKDGYELLRPKGEEQLFFGPLDDAFREGEMFGYLPLYKESRYCASCHEGVVFGVHVYGTYSEWLKSPARKKGIHCQQCHMKPTGKMTNIAPGRGGIERAPHTLASHHFPGGTREMLKSCLQLKVDLNAKPKKTALSIEVTARNVGHHVPTGFIDRHVILVVEAFDRNDKEVKQLNGLSLPKAAGKKLTGKAGKLFAKLLYDTNGIAPIPFWLPHGKIVDTRLVPQRTDRSRFEFPALAQRLRVRLLYRRFWKDVADAKGWPNDEIVVAERILKAPAAK